MSTLPEVTIYTDGACIPNPGLGGWGAVLLFEALDGRKIKKELSGAVPDTTNNRMELTAVIEALRALKTACTVRVMSDSQWVIKCATGEWSRAKNGDLWALYDDAAKQHVVRFSWVRGHTGDRWNERAHELANRDFRKAG